MDIYFIVPVWGEDYTKFFVDYGLPSQLSGKNIPGMIFSKINYLIYTTIEDWPLIYNSLSYKYLIFFAKVKIFFIKLKKRLNIHNKMTWCYKQGIKLANKKNAVSIFITPDLLISDGSLIAVEKILQSGKKAILLTGIRTSKEKISGMLFEFINSGVLTIQSRDLMKITMHSLHQLAHASIINGGENPWLMPSNFYWMIKGKGLIAHCFHLHPLAVLPRKKKLCFVKTIDDGYVESVCPDFKDIYIVKDSDEILVIECTTDQRKSKTNIPNKNFYNEELFKWIVLHTRKSHHFNIYNQIFMHVDDVNVEEWSKLEKTAQEYIKYIMCKSYNNKIKNFVLFTKEWVSNIINQMRRIAYNIRKLFIPSFIINSFDS